MGIRGSKKTLCLNARIDLFGKEIELSAVHFLAVVFSQTPLQPGFLGCA